MACILHVVRLEPVQTVKEDKRKLEPCDSQKQKTGVKQNKRRDSTVKSNKIRFDLQAKQNVLSERSWFFDCQVKTKQKIARGQLRM